MGQPVEADAGVVAFADRMLRALVDLAGHGPGPRAELATALRAANLATDHPLIRAALQLLLAHGLVTSATPLPDGGLLLTVDARAARASRTLR